MKTKKHIKERYVRNENFHDEYHGLTAFEDQQTKLILGYYRPEVYYAPYGAEHISRKEFLKRTGLKEINFYKIKNMTFDELAEFFAIHFECKICPAKRPKQLCEDCIEWIKSWLLQEVEE